MSLFRRRDSFHDESFLGRFVTGPLSRIGERIARAFRPSDGSIGEVGIWRRLGAAAATLLQLLIVGPITFLLTVWSSSRDAVHFMLGLPALLTALIAVTPGLAFYYSNDQIRRMYDGLSRRAINAYDELSSRALNAENLRLAELYTQKLFKLAPDNQEYYVRLASTIGEKRGDSQYSLDLIEQVAVEVDTASINGHYWIAKHLVGKPEGLSDEDIAKAERHLDMALQADPQHFDVNALAYDLYLKAGRPEDALQYIRVVAKIEPLTSHLLLKLLKDLGKTDEFHATLTNVVLTVSEVANRYPNEIVLWKELVQCCMLDERYQEAFSHVQNGLSLATNPNVRLEMSVLASTVLLGWHDKVMSFTDKTQFQEAIKSLNSALNIFVYNGEALRRASNVYLDPNLDSKRVGWVMESMATDENMYCTHLMIGWRALFIDKENGVSTARVHWQIADASEPQMFGTILAQLTLIVASTEPDKIPFALQAVDLGMSVSPTQVELAEARGLILMYAERWFEARQQLEEILPLTTRKDFVLKKLIKCCEELDDKVKAAEFRAMLEQLEGSDGSTT